MSRFARSLLCAFALATPAIHGCVASHSAPSLDVEASIASVTLADDCAEGEPEGARFAGDCAEDVECGSWCTQTGVQLSLEAGDGDSSVPFEVIAVRLTTLDGTFIESLDPRGARIFGDDGYQIWDERIDPGQLLQVSYDTSAPDWTAIGGGNAWATHGMQFRIEMVVRIDGVDHTLEFAPASRQAEIVT